MRAEVAARQLWTVAEPFHALTYFAPESHQAFADAGLRGFWRGYFAGRAAPLGPAPATVVAETFYGFHPEFVARAVPSIWDVVKPARAIAARLEGIDRATHRIFRADPPTRAMRDAATAIRDAIELTPVDDLPLFAANVGLEWPDAPSVQLWHAVTLLREHRGDGHVRALVAADVGPCDAHVLRISDQGLPLSSIQPYRGWSEADWADAATRLRAHGWIGDDGRTTAAGTDARADIERRTDELSADLTDRIPEPDRVVAVLDPISRHLEISGEIPFPNPIGVPAPTG